MKKVVVMFALVFLMFGVSAVEDNSSSIFGLGEGKSYTDNFYISLGLAVLVIFILGLLIWLWLRGPRNKWDK